MHHEVMYACMPSLDPEAGRHQEQSWMSHVDALLSHEFCSSIHTASLCGVAEACSLYFTLLHFTDVLLLLTWTDKATAEGVDARMTCVAKSMLCKQLDHSFLRVCAVGSVQP